MPFLNVADFGAKGDGSTDDTAAIKRTIAEAAKTRQAVYLPGGTFMVSSPLECPPDSVLTGASPVRTTIMASGKFNFRGPDDAIIKSQGVRHDAPGTSRRLTMSGIKVDGNRRLRSNGILVSPQQPAYMENVRADKCMGYGLAVVDCQQMIFRNIELIDNAIGLRINSGEFLYFYDLNIERSTQAYVLMTQQKIAGANGAQGIRNQSIHFIGTHMEQTGQNLNVPFFDVRSGKALLFQNTYFSAGNGTLFKFSGDPATMTEQGHTYIITDAQTAGTPAQVTFLEDSARGLRLNTFETFRGHVPMFIAPPLNTSPWSGPSLWLAGQAGKHLKLGASPGTPQIDSQSQVGDTDQAVWRDSQGRPRASVSADGQGRFGAGVATRVVNGTVSDQVFDKPPPDGTLAVDSGSGRLWARIGGKWRSIKFD